MGPHTRYSADAFSWRLPLPLQSRATKGKVSLHGGAAFAIQPHSQSHGRDTRSSCRQEPHAARLLQVDALGGAQRRAAGQHALHAVLALQLRRQQPKVALHVAQPRPRAAAVLGLLAA